MKKSKKEFMFLEEICNDEKLDVSFFSIEFPDGSSYEYQVNSDIDKKN